MLRRVLAKLRGFSNDGGIATLEFALVAAPFIGFIVAIFQSFVAQIYITYLDRAVQSFAAELRSGSIITYDTKTQELMQQLINTRLCPRVKPLAGLDCTKMQVQLFKGASCTTITTTIGCWDEQSNVLTNDTAPPSYQNRSDPSGSAMADCHAFSTGIRDVYCVLVPRTQYYGFQLRVQGPYLMSVAGTPYAETDLQLGTGGAFLDSLEVTLLSPGVKNRFRGSANSPGDFDGYLNDCYTNLAAGTPMATARNIISGGAPVWPGYTKINLNRLTVTAPSK